MVIYFVERAIKDIHDAQWHENYLKTLPSEERERALAPLHDKELYLSLVGTSEDPGFPPI